MEGIVKLAERAELNPGTLAWVMRRRVDRRCIAIQ
jgi:hypothetical protein